MTDATQHENAHEVAHEVAHVAMLQRQAAHVLGTVCHETHWLGLDRDDLVSEGWLAYDAAIRRAGVASDSYARASSWHAMRRAALSWLGRTGRSGVQFLQADVDVAAPSVEDDASSDDRFDGLAVDAAALFAHLTPHARAVLDAIYRDGMTPQQAASATGLSAKQVRRLRYTAIETLRAYAGRPTAAKLRQRERNAAWIANNRDRVALIGARYRDRLRGFPLRPELN